MYWLYIREVILSQILQVMTTMKRSYKEYQRDVDCIIKKETEGFLRCLSAQYA